MTQIDNLQHAARIEQLGLAVPVAEKEDPKALGQEQFFELMIAQLKNQDPLKPLDSTEFLSQLAQFSTVAGVNGMERSMSELAASLQSSQALQASTLVGRDVLARGRRLELAAEGSASGAVELDAASAAVVVTISDPAGRQVRRLELGAQAAGTIEFQWDGLDDAGERAAPGYYEVSAIARRDGADQALPTLVRSRVESVTLGASASGVTLNLRGLGPLDLAEIERLL